MRTALLAAAAVAGVTAQVNQYTATATASVEAAQATAKTSHKTSNVKGKAFDRFITLWLENTDYALGAADPNLAWLATQGITLENYFGVTHPSEPNYCASHGGDNFGMDNDQFWQVDGNVSTITALLEDKGITWGSYQQDMPYTGYEGYNWLNEQTQANDYVRKHNPPVLYDRNDDAERLTYQKNLTVFTEDLQGKTLPQWIFITPNMTSDGHDTSVTVAGAFTRGFLEPLMKNKYFWDNTLILVTFDETETYTESNRVFSILLGGAVPKHLVGTKDANFYNHYSELATVEANWGLHTLGRWDVGANVFEFVAQQTGDKVRPNRAALGRNPTHFYNASFAGPFNVDFKNASYPAPNLKIKSPNTGRTVLPAIVDTWKNSKLPTYYNDGVVVPDGQNPPAGYAANN